MEEAEWLPVRQPDVVDSRNSPAVQVPMTDVQTRVLLDMNSIEEGNGQVEEFLIEEVARREVDHALVGDLPLPPAQDPQGVRAVRGADEPQIERTATHDGGIIGNTAVVGEVGIEVGRQED